LVGVAKVVAVKSAGIERVAGEFDLVELVDVAEWRDPVLRVLERERDACFARWTFRVRVNEGRTENLCFPSL